MNLGLGNLTELKQHLLAEQYREDAGFEAALQALGSGVAASFERYCNCQFARVANDTYTVCADGEIYYLPRRPIEAVASVHLRITMTEGWVEQTDAILTQHEVSGRIQLYAPLGDYRSQVRFTYTGGYWWDTSEDASEAMPAGATGRPDDLKLAWLLQCKRVWEAYDPTGVRIAREAAAAAGGLTSMLKELELIPAVKELINPHRRLFS